ncbi:MAG: AlbA family DNA-binding domain-containing protein [Steroidobacteraceae bacterium]
MDREYITDRVPDKLIQRIDALGSAGRFRRRAVLTKGNTRWELVCCIVEAFLPGERVPECMPPRRYQQATLYEDYLTTQECLEFARRLQEGHASFDGIDLQRSQNAHWSVELLPVNNDFMERAGYVIALQFGQGGSRASVRTLLATDQPYYPDGDEATRDWLSLRVYHGHSDTRNDHVIFLLPETRAYIASATFSDKGTLDIRVAGTGVGALPLLIKGAYWEGKAMRHIDAPIINSKAEIAMPRDADSFEYYLIDGAAAVYDFHREDRFSQLQQGRRTIGAVEDTLADQIRKACREGEGRHVEFKPFIDPSQKLKANDRKTKLLETIITVAAFANTGGGHIYLGVEDDCTVSGVDVELRTWAKGTLNESNISRYLGVLKSKIKELVYGEVTLRLSHAELNGGTVIVIEVPEATQKPIAIHGDRHLYIRAGASNQKASPELWRGILKSDKPLGLF